MSLEDATPRASARGILLDSAVTVVNVEWHGRDALTFVNREPACCAAGGGLSRHNDPGIEVVEHGRPWRRSGGTTRSNVIGSTRRLKSWTSYQRSRSPKVKGRLHEIWQSAANRDGPAAFDEQNSYRLPAEHWRLLRTTNPIRV